MIQEIVMVAVAAGGAEVVGGAVEGTVILGAMTEAETMSPALQGGALARGTMVMATRASLATKSWTHLGIGEAVDGVAVEMEVEAHGVMGEVVAGGVVGVGVLELMAEVVVDGEGLNSPRNWSLSLMPVAGMQETVVVGNGEEW